MAPLLGLLLLLVLAWVMLACWGGAIVAWDAAHPPRKGFAWALADGRPGDPAAIGLASEEVAMPGLDGVTCPGWRVACEGGMQAPSLLLLHGWGRSRWDSLSRLAELRGLVHEAWLPDLPAHGEHRARSGWVGVREPEAAAAMLADMAAPRPGAPLVVMGHSLGAGVALRGAMLASRRGVPVHGVILLAPYRDLRSPIPGRLGLKNLPVQPFTWVALRMLRAFGRMDASLEVDAAGCSLPLLVLACQDDRIAPAADARAIATAAPHARLVVLPGDRHDEPAHGDRAAWLAAARAFLETVSRRSPAPAAGSA
ncbi:MAG: alpha/beta hydrolase [Phycisphaerales bacterium]